MNAGGWVIMICSIGAVMALAGYCMARVLALPPTDVESHLKAPPDIDTRDRLDAD